MGTRFRIRINISILIHFVCVLSDYPAKFRSSLQPTTLTDGYKYTHNRAQTYTHSHQQLQQ